MDVVAPEHEVIHRDLERWGLWCIYRSGGKGASSIEALYRNGRDGTPAATAPTLDHRSIEIERALVNFPQQHRDALRLFYVQGKNPSCICRAFDLKPDVFPSWMYMARAMLLGRLRAPAAPLAPHTLAPSAQPARF